MKVLIPAAGHGKRMKSETPKFLHKILGKEIIKYVIDAALALSPDEIYVITGVGSESVRKCVSEYKPEVRFVEQKEQLGTGHAIMSAAEHLKGGGEVLVLFGDCPMISGETLKDMYAKHCLNKSRDLAVTLATVCVDDPTDLGRIVREDGKFVRIVEQKDADAETLKITETNPSIYIFTEKSLYNILPKLSNKNAQGEYYLTDTVGLLVNEGQRVETYEIAEQAQAMNVNDRVQLAQAVDIMKKRINNFHMRNGVTIIDPNTTYIDDTVSIGCDSIIYPNTILEGKTEIGGSTVIGPNSRIVDSVICDGAEILNSVVMQSGVGANTHVGPFAYLRPNSKVGADCKIGDFVEIKNASIGNGTKVSHLSYIGDAEVGSGVNFSCGAITSNYDGVHKYRAIIKDNAFIGCNTNLVAPVTVNERGYTAAGSTITEDVPAGALAIARERQTNKEGWRDRKGL